MNRLKNRLAGTLHKIRNPEEDTSQFREKIGFKRLLFLAPFIIAAIIFLLLSLES